MVQKVISKKPLMGRHAWTLVLEDGTEVLQSYETMVCLRKDMGGDCEDLVLVSDGASYSRTTEKHVRTFLGSSLKEVGHVDVKVFNLGLIVENGDLELKDCVAEKITELIG